MEETNPKIQEISNLEREIDQTVTIIKTLPEEQREPYAIQLKRKSKDYHLLTGHHYRPEGGW